MNIQQLVVFCILMENRDGIIGKAPSYMKEKYHSVLMRRNDTELMALLDRKNQFKYVQWFGRWGRVGMDVLTEDL